MSACDGIAPPAASPSTNARDQPLRVPLKGRERSILVFGDSLLTGVGLEGGHSYPGKLEAAMRARGIKARVSNAGVLGETTEKALRRLVATLDAQSTGPEVVIISLGGNDMLQGVPPAELQTNLSQILSILRERHVPVVLLGMLAAPSFSREYAQDFNPIYPRLADTYEAVLVPFYLQPAFEDPDIVGGQVHPAAHGVDEIVAATVDDIVDALPNH